MDQGPGHPALLDRILEGGRALADSSQQRQHLGLDPAWPPLGVGIPIGNLTSQWWGNHYLSGADHLLCREFGVAHAQRYMDDIAIFDDDAPKLVRVRDRLAEWLIHERRLRLKRPEAQPRPSRRAFDYLGRRVTRTSIEPTRRAWRRMEIGVGKLVADGNTTDISRSIPARLGALGLSQGRRVGGFGD